MNLVITFIGALVASINIDIGFIIVFIPVIILGFILIIFPFATPETFNVLGIKKTKLMVRGVGIIIWVLSLLCISI